MVKLQLAILILVCLTVCDSGSQPESQLMADLVLTNGRIYTLDSDKPWVEAVAIKDGKYKFLGSAAKTAPYVGDRTKVIDLDGRMAMPSINDAHVHTTIGGIKELYQCSFAATATPDKIAQVIAGCVKENPDAEWIIGGQWYSNLFMDHSVGSPRLFLDKVSGDKAVYLLSDSYHDGWANSKALALAGIDKYTDDVQGGMIVKEAESGEPNGLLFEHARGALLEVIPDWTPDQYRAGVARSVEIANQFGITGLKESSADAQTLKAIKALGDTGDLTANFAVSIDVKLALEDGQIQIDKIFALRDQYSAARVDTRFVKVVLDGVPTSSRTAAMLEDYLPVESGGETHNGWLHYKPEQLVDMMVKMDKAGITVKIHTAGDRAVRVALDAIEQARQANGESGLRHELAHAGYIHKDDLPRFAELGVVADLSPYLWYPSPLIDSNKSALGERAERYWPIKDLLASDVWVAAGSDWPVATMNPWVGIEAMVSRADPQGQFSDTLWPEQAISLQQAVRIFTLDSAKALRLEKRSGSVAIGKSADLIVLDRHLFDVPVADISDTEVELTLFEGRVVFQREK